MAIPAYLWLKDDGGTDIKGSVDVQYREVSLPAMVTAQLRAFGTIQVY